MRTYFTLLFEDLFKNFIFWYKFTTMTFKLCALHIVCLCVIDLRYLLLLYRDERHVCCIITHVLLNA